jgi:hypothetical protein
MPVAYNSKKAIHIPTWQWLNQYPSGSSNPGTSNNYDGVRYMYWAVQSGSTSAASTTQLWRYDTWTNGWQFLVSLASCFSGLEIEYDPIRNLVWIAEGNNTAVWRYFNLNSVSVTILGITTPAWTLSAPMAPALPTGANTWSAFDHASDGDIPAQISLRGAPAPAAKGLGLAPDGHSDRTTGVTDASSTTTSIVDSSAEFHDGMKGCYVRFLSTTTTVALRNQQRPIAAAASPTALTVVAFATAPVAGDQFVIEVPGGRPDISGSGAQPLQATGGSATTLVMAAAGWITNIYALADVVIVGGTGIGQRRRIGSNDGTTLTLAGATAGNARTGNWTTAPDATSTFRIIPSEDFLYYASTTAALYRQDLAATAVSWTALAVPPAAFGTGGQVMRTPTFAPFSIVALRGAATATAWRYDIGLATWTVLPTLWASDTLSTGAVTVRMPGRHRFYMIIGNSQRNNIWNPVLGTLEPAVYLPYVAGSAYDGKRARFIKTVDGVEFFYVMRAGGQEFWRIPVTWLD